MCCCIAFRLNYCNMLYLNQHQEIHGFHLFCNMIFIQNRISLKSIYVFNIVFNQVLQLGS